MAKYNSVTSKEDRQNNKLRKQCSKFPSKTLISLSVFYANFEQCLTNVNCLKFKNIRYIQR